MIAWTPQKCFPSENKVDILGRSLALQHHITLGRHHRARPDREGGLGKGVWKEAEFRMGFGAPSALRKPPEGKRRETGSLE